MEVWVQTTLRPADFIKKLPEKTSTQKKTVLTRVVKTKLQEHPERDNPP